MYTRFILSFLLGLALGLRSAAQIQEPVKFKHEWKQLSATEAEIVFTATVDPGWHVYSTDLPDGGPIAATFNTDRLEGAETAAPLEPRGKVVEKMDPLFQMEVKYFEGRFP